MYNKSYVHKQLKKLAPTLKIMEDEPLKNHTSYKIGGNADFVVMPKTLEEVVRVVNFLQNSKVPYYTLGNGTNILVSDKGYKGVIIKTELLNRIEIRGNIVRVEGGASLNTLIGVVCEKGLQGMQEGSGIPGTVGGAVIMNASAYGYETKEVIIGVLVLLEGKIKYYNKQECDFVYRNSVFSTLKNVIVLRVDILLSHGNAEELMKTRKEIIAKREFNQPLDKPNAGSVFKRLDGIIVSKLIDDNGLKGYTVGGAQVSQKHAGFIVNYDNNAKADDVRGVIKHVKEVMLEKEGLALEEEIKFLGEFD